MSGEGPRQPLFAGPRRIRGPNGDFDPDDPLVNTRSELMYEYATITYHVLHSNVAVTLTDADVPITYRGVEYTEPGTYNITLEHYYAHLDRTNPIERQLREAWSPLAFSLTSSLAGAHANQAAGELAYMTTLGLGGISLLFVLAGVGLVWATWGPQARTLGAQGAEESVRAHRPKGSKPLVLQ